MMPLRTLLISVLSLIVLSGYGQSPFVGTWNSSRFSRDDQTTASATMALTEEKGELKGSIRMASWDKEADDILRRVNFTGFELELLTVEGRVLSFEVPITPGDPGDNLVCKLTLKGDSLTGQVWAAKSPEKKNAVQFKRRTAKDGIEELAEELVEAFAADDPIQYAQCWTRWHQTVENLKLVFGNRLEEGDFKRQLKKMHERNVAVRHSFRILREELDRTFPKQKTKPRQTPVIKYDGVDVRKIEKVKFGDKTAHVADRVVVRFKVGEHTWELVLDDAVELDGRWYVSDDAVELETHERRLSLRLSKGKYGHVIEVKNKGVQL